MTAAKFSRLGLWSRLWGGGVAWLLHFMGIWVAAEFGCLSSLARPGWAGISLVAWLVLILSAASIGLTAWYTIHAWSREFQSGEETDGFLHRFARVANCIFLLVIVAQTLPVFFYLKDCGSAIE